MKTYKIYVNPQGTGEKESKKIIETLKQINRNADVAWSGTAGNQFIHYRCIRSKSAPRRIFFERCGNV